MITKYAHKKLTWIDVENPNPEEVRSLADEYHINPLVANELLSPTLRPKVELHHNLIYLILHFPAFARTPGQHNADQEIDFIIGKNFLITTHYKRIDTLYEFSKAFEVNSILDKSNLGDHAGFLFFYLIRQLYKFLEEELDSVTTDLKDIEARIFQGEEKQMVFEISKVNRNLLNFRQATRPHQEVLASFEVAGKKFFGEDFSYYLHAISGEYYKISNILEGNRETLLGLRDTNDALLTTKTNEVMKTLTVMAFVTFALMLISSIFGMNTKILPIVGMPNDFWVIIIGIALATVSMFIFFKHKRWI
ncbi:MAG: magnesium transporter CorA family protein [Candidatus Lloydbacteria bacterium]|nr:magnesium transporter CorA family protein [Candidatus Lloydbacteria bacterium]